LVATDWASISSIVILIYEPVSKYPSTYRDISFVIEKNIALNDYFDLIRDIGGDLVEEVQVLDTYENTEKFGAKKISYTLRIIYRSHEKTLTNDEINEIQFALRDATEKLWAELR